MTGKTRVGRVKKSEKLTIEIKHNISFGPVKGHYLLPALLL